MTDATQDERSETKRHTTDVDASELSEGDQIARELVARHVDQLGEPQHPRVPEVDEPPMQLVQVSDIRDADDTHTALLYDPETELFVRATRIDRGQAWTQSEADWTVRDVGREIDVVGVHSLERPESEQDQGRREYAAEWLEILTDDIRYNDGGRDLSEELHVDGPSVFVRDWDGRSFNAEIELIGGDE